AATKRVPSMPTVHWTVGTDAQSPVQPVKAWAELAPRAVKRTCALPSKLWAHVGAHTIPAGADCTMPSPWPALVTWSTNVVVGDGSGGGDVGGGAVGPVGGSDGGMKIALGRGA